MLIRVAELTMSYCGTHFISRYGCKEYFAHNKELLFYERQKEIIQQIEALEMDLDGDESASVSIEISPGTTSMN